MKKGIVLLAIALMNVSSLLAEDQKAATVVTPQKVEKEPGAFTKLLNYLRFGKSKIETPTTSPQLQKSGSKMATNKLCPSPSYTQQNLKASVKKTLFTGVVRDWQKNNKDSAILKHAGANCLRVGTYNVHSFIDPLGKNSLAATLSSIKALDADVLVLQEVKSCKTKKYCDLQAAFASLGYDSYFAGYRAPHKSKQPKNVIPFGIAMLVRKGIALAPVVEQTKDESCRYEGKFCKIYSLDKSRSVMILELDLRAYKQPNIVIFGTSLQHDNKYEEQIAEAYRLCELANSPELRNKNVILAADFNAKDDSETMKIFYNHGFVSGFALAGIKQGQCFTSWTGHKIDDLLFKHPQGALSMVGLSIGYTNASVHLPVIIDLKVR